MVYWWRYRDREHWLRERKCFGEKLEPVLAHSSGSTRSRAPKTAPIRERNLIWYFRIFR